MTATIVVGVDGSEQSLDAVRWAVAFGEATGGTVRAVLVWSLLDQHHADAVRFDPAYGEDDALADLGRFLEQAVGERAAGVERSAPCDLPVEGLLEAARGASLLVVGARGLGGFRGLLLGSVSRKVLERSTAPVAVIRTGLPADGGRVLVGVDGSAESMAALRWAAATASATGRTLAVLHAWMVPWPIDLQTHAMALAVCREEGERVLRDAVAAVPDDVKVEPILVEGGAASALLEEAAQDTSLLVVSTRGRGGPLAALLGSVSHQLAHHAPVPLVVVPTKA